METCIQYLTPMVYINIFQKFSQVLRYCIPSKSYWITKGLSKSSKQKQKLYKRFLRNKDLANNSIHIYVLFYFIYILFKSIYKTHKSLLESLKKKSKKNYNTNCLEKYQNDIKKMWNLIKEITGNTIL